MAPGWVQILVVVLVVLLLFGRGKIGDLMGDVARGIRSFRKGLSEDDTAAPDGDASPGRIAHETSARASASAPRTGSKAGAPAAADRVAGGPGRR